MGARPGMSLTIEDIDHYKEGDNGTVVKVEAERVYIAWDRTARVTRFRNDAWLAYFKLLAGEKAEPFVPEIGGRLQARPGYSFEAEGVKFYTGNDTGTIAKLDGEKVYVAWDQTERVTKFQKDLLLADCKPLPGEKT